MSQHQNLQQKMQATVKDLSVTAAIAMPVVALVVWWSIRRIHNKVFQT